MPRLIKKTAHGPKDVEGKMICMCGLSKNQPFCDGSHNKTIGEDEKKLYWYDEKGNREEVETEAGCTCENGEGCCGGKCEEDTKTK